MIFIKNCECPAKPILVCSLKERSVKNLSFRLFHFRFFFRGCFSKQS